MFKLMKWKKSCVACLIMLAMLGNTMLGGLGGSFSAQAATAVTINDGSFETYTTFAATLKSKGKAYMDGTTSGNNKWYCYTSGANQMNHAVVQSVSSGESAVDASYDGDYGLAVSPVDVAAGKDTYTQVAFRKTGLTAGATYEVSVYVKPVDVVSTGSASGSLGRVELELKGTVNGENNKTKKVSYILSSAAATTDAEWTKLTLRIQPGSSKDIYINLYPKKFTSGYWLIDNVTMQKIDEPTVSITSAPQYLPVGDTGVISAAVTDVDSAATSGVTWSSSDDSIATVTVSESGDREATVSAVSAGTATITATVLNSVGTAVTATYDVNVVQIGLDKTEAKVKVGKTIDLTATLSGVEAFTNRTVTWTSSDEATATVAAGTDSKTATVTGVKTSDEPITVTATVKDEDGAVITSVDCLVAVKEIVEPTITLSSSSLDMNVGGSASLLATVADYDSITTGQVEWTSSDESVATITVSQTDDCETAINAVSAGTATITATIKSADGSVVKTAECTVTVTVEVEGIALSETALELDEGKESVLTVTFNPENATDKTLTWASSDEATATVTVNESNGAEATVSALAEGTATITVTSANGKTATCEVTVKKVIVAVEGISIAGSMELGVGHKWTPMVTFSPENATDTTLTWASTDESVVTVDASTGRVTAVALGSAIITATTANGKAASCTVTVTNNLLKNGGFDMADGTDMRTAKNSVTKYIVSGNADTGWIATNYWSKTGGMNVLFSIGDVDGYDGGKALMIARDESATAGLEITRAVAYQKDIQLADGQTYIFKAKVKAADVTGSSNPYLALSVTTASGTDKTLCKITAKDAGDGQWHWIEGEFTVSTGYKVTTRVNVYDLLSGYWLIDDVSFTKKPEKPTAAITLDGAAVSGVEAEIGETVQLAATMDDPDNVLGGEAVAFSWSSSNEAVATVDTNGKVTAVGIGETVITATSGDGTYSAACSVTVTEVFVELEDISLAKAALELRVGGQETLAATVTPADATDQTLIWTSSDEQVAAVDENGTVTGLGAGTATVTVTTANGKTASCTVSVSVSETLTTSPISLETAFGTPLTGDLSTNVTNNTGETAVYKLYTAPVNGTVTVNTDGTFTYVPQTTSDTASDSFVVVVTAGSESAILTGTVTIGSLSDSILENLVQGSSLLFSRAELEAVKADIATEGSFRNEIWNEYQSYLTGRLNSTPTAYHQDGTDLWQRSVADSLVCLLVGYLITGEDAYRDKCLEYAETIANYDYWGYTEYWMQADLAAGHNAFALALVYDWMKDEMSTELRNTILMRLYYACQCFEGYWDEVDFYMHNHSWIGMGGLAAATVAIYLDKEYAVGVVKGDSDLGSMKAGNNKPDYDVDVTMAHLQANCNRWLELVMDQVGTSYEWMPEDGTNPEGAGYAEYGTEWLIKISLLLEHNLGIDTFTGNGYLENHSEFFLNVIYPENSLNSAENLINYADGESVSWYGPTGHMRVLAATYQDGTAQWIAEVMEESGATIKNSFWMGLIWGDGSVEAKLDTDKSTLYYSEDMGLVVVRSDWSGDESMLFMRSGLPLGKGGNGLLATDTNEYHVDPDCNAIILFSNGEYLLKTGGYTWKATGNNNTLLLNGAGQIGEGAKGFVGDAFVTYNFEPTMTVIEDTDTYSYFVGDATEAYAPDKNLNKFQRNVIFLKEENVVLVVDDIQSAQKSDLELRWFTESKTVVESYGIYSVYGDNNTMNFYPFNTMYGDSVTTTFSAVDVYDLNNKKSSEETFVQTCSGTTWQNAAAFSWAPEGAEMTQVAYAAGGVNEHRFEVNGKIYTLNVSSNTLTVESGSLNQENGWDADSALSNVLFNQSTLENFDGAVLTQDVERFWKTEELTITAIPSSPTATAVVEWDGTCPGAVTITCTSGDKSSTTIYTLNLKNDNGMLSIHSASSTPNTGGISETLTYDNFIQNSGTDKTWASTKLPVITYDMGCLVDISKIDVAFNNSRDRVTYYNLLISEDGENWTVVQDDATAEKTTDAARSAYTTIYEDDALRALYVRFELRGHTNANSKDSNGAYNSIQDISFYGAVVVTEEKTEPQIIAEATDTSYTLGSMKTVTISCTGEVDEFVSAALDGAEIAADNYTVKAGSTVLTLKTEYLETLSVGEHAVTLHYTGERSVSSDLTVLAKAEESTESTENESTSSTEGNGAGESNGATEGGNSESTDATEGGNSEESADAGGNTESEENTGAAGDGSTGSTEGAGTTGDGSTGGNTGSAGSGSTGGNSGTAGGSSGSGGSANQGSDPNADTGDGSHSAWWIVCMLISMVGIAISMVVRKRKSC